jgi:biotin synthase-related radical SAM superfamily protein
MRSMRESDSRTIAFSPDFVAASTSLPKLCARAASSEGNPVVATARRTARATRSVSEAESSKAAARLTISLIVLPDLARTSFLIIGRRSTKVLRVITMF